MHYIEVQDVVKQYSGHTALNHVSLSVDKGTIYGLLGPNGAGKTSLIRIINQITRPDSGTLLLDGKPMTPADVAKIGYLPEERGLYKKMRVADHIVYLARLKGMEKSDAVQQTQLWLNRFDLTQWAGKKIESLSKGMAQKVQFIATVIHRPQLLIFDEPFSGFDPVNAEILKQEILRLGNEGATILFSTHNMSSVEAICREITLINHAQVVLQGNVDQIRQQYKKNIFSVTVAEGAVAPCPQLFSIEQISSSQAAGNQVLIRLNPDVTTRQAIEWLNANYSLLAFSEQLPTMNEIFIETVTGKTTNQGGLMQ